MEETLKKKNKLIIIICTITCLFVFIFFYKGLDSSWKYYDEDIIFNETILPIPSNFSEALELIRLFGINNHFIAGNTFYSDISNIRSDPINNLLILFVFFLFQKNAFLYHLLSLSMHVLNTCLLFFIINKITETYNPASIKLRFFITAALTLLWSLHPANVEPVLFASNWPTLLSYTLTFILVFCFLNIKTKRSKLFFITTFLLYLATLFICEHSVTLPLILFFYFYATNSFLNQNASIKESIKVAFKKTLPLFLVLFIFIFYFFFSPLKENIHVITNASLTTTLQRIFWLSPHIFSHLVKLTLFPLSLSLDQTAHIRLSDELFSTYAVFCFTFMFGLIALAKISFFKVKKRIFFYIFILFVPFFLAILPFLHLISPIYNLSSERYLYAPTFFLIIGISHILLSYTNNIKSLRIPLSLISIVLIIFGSRAFFRTLDWNDNYSLLKATINNSPNNLYKGLRLYMLADSIKTFQGETFEKDINRYYQSAEESLNNALVYYKNKKLKHQNNIPEVVKYYGLDPKTLEAKTAFLIAYINYSRDEDPNKAYDTFGPYAENLASFDTTILDFYYKILFLTKNIEKAESILQKNLNIRRLSPILFVALSDLSEYKYKDLDQTKKYLNESCKYFPYDPATLFALKRFYNIQNDANNFAHYSYLFGLRTHNPDSLKEAAVIYTALNNKEKAEKIIMGYKKVFGEL